MIKTKATVSFKKQQFVVRNLKNEDLLNEPSLLKFLDILKNNL
ncbi:hypothetical protein RU99_GL000021 [Enterococcus casseliflavus]|nr:hypothetical protein RU99_GL000021 [Enterococcus casseliflavus]